MKIVFVASQFLPFVGGAEVNLARLTAMLHAQGHDVEVITLRRQRSWPPYETIGDVPVTRVDGIFRHGALDLRHGLEMVAYANAALALRPRVRSCDLVYCLGLNPMSASAAWLARRAGKPALVRIANSGPPPGTPWSDENRPQKMMAATLPGDLPCLRIPPNTYVGNDIDHLRSLHPLLVKPTLSALRGENVHLIALSTLMRERLVALGFAPERITIIPNTLDAETFSASASEASAPHPPTALCVARHTPQKGIDVALHAWRIVHERMPQARLIFLGDGPLRAQHEALAAALDLGDSVEFRGPVRDVASVLARTDCFVLSSRWEGFSTALLEACVAGVPSVATDVSGVRDLLEDGQTGFIVPYDDYHQLAERILLILSDPELGRRIGASAAQRVRESFTQQQAIDRLFALFAHVTAPSQQKMQP